MEKPSRFGELIKALRKDKTQAQFAEILGVTQPMISAWEGGSDEPSCEMFAKLGNLSSYPDNIWFWQEAGLDPQRMFSAAEQALKELRTPANAGEVIPIPRFRLTAQRGEEAGPRILIAAERVPNPLSTFCYVLDEKTAGLCFGPGDIVALDISAGGPTDFQAFSDQVGLVQFAPRAEQQKPEWVDWPEGPVWGRLRCKRWWSNDNSWDATLGPAMDTRTKYTPGDGSILIGYWGDRDSPSGFGEGPVPEKARLGAAAKIQLFGGCQIVGRVIAWFPAPSEKK
jgi:transcriptional regulator with XRE-family HTH domain